MSLEVRCKIQELYLHQDPAIQKAADNALQEFQKTDLAWSVGQELLNDGDPSVQFFAAQTLYSKVQQVALGYEQEVSVDLHALVPVLQRYLGLSSLSQQARHRLVLALAVAAVHLCTSTWKGAVQDLLNLADSQPQCAWCALLAIPEQLSAVARTYLKTDRRTQALLASSDALIAGALHFSPATAEDALTGTLGDSPFSLAMQALVQWSKVLGLALVAHGGFAARLVELLQGPAASSEVVLEAVLEVLRSSPGAFAIYEGVRSPAPALERVLAAIAGSMRALLPGVQQMASRPVVVPLDEADAQRLSRWARVAGTLVEAYTQVLWVDAEAAEVLVGFLGACFMVHPSVAQPIFELWAILKDASRDGKLPSGVLAGLLQKLARPCVTSFTRFGRYGSPCAGDQAELEQLRGAQQDILVDMYCIAAGTAEAQLILTLLCDALRTFEGTQDWHGVEVVWFAFSGIAEVLVDEPPIPEAYQMVLRSVFCAELTTEEQCATAATLLRVCGPHFEQILRPQLVPSVQWLVSVMPRIPSVASEALQELCGYAGQHLLPHVEELLKVVVAAVPSLPAEVDAALHGALAGIVRGLQGEQAVAAFVQICSGTAAALAEGLDVGQAAGREKLHRCACRLLRCTIVMREGGPNCSPDSAAPGQPSPAAKTAAMCLERVLNAQWRSIALPCRHLICAAPISRDVLKGKPVFEYSDVAVQVNVLALLRYMARAANEALTGGPELGLHLVEFAVACCGEGQFAPLSAVAVLAANPELARTHVLPALDGVCQETMRHAHAGCAAEDLIPVLELLSSLAASVGEELFQAPQLPVLTQLCASAIRTTDQDILKPALLFLQKLATSRLPGCEARCCAPEQDVRGIIQAVLLHFHTWPRSAGAQTFKLFCALLERHEGLFLPLVTSPSLPCVAGLAPAEQAIAHAAFRRLRGGRLRAFLGDLGAVARRENSADILQAYAMEP